MRYERAFAIADRHDRLIDLIQSGDYSSGDLAEKLRVSEPTVYRDIGHLKLRGYSICSEKCADGWYYRLLAEPAVVSSGKGTPNI